MIFFFSKRSTTAPANGSKTNDTTGPINCVPPKARAELVLDKTSNPITNDRTLLPNEPNIKEVMILTICLFPSFISSHLFLIIFSFIVS